MIKITASRNNGKITSLTVKGHANSAPHGEDLVCAAVSSILVGGCNALKEPNCFAIKLNEGDPPCPRDLAPCCSSTWHTLSCLFILPPPLPSLSVISHKEHALI